jgi:hypothetical protein
MASPNPAVISPTIEENGIFDGLEGSARETLQGYVFWSYHEEGEA